jgi:hypothetical protein
MGEWKSMHGGVGEGASEYYEAFFMAPLLLIAFQILT